MYYIWYGSVQATPTYRVYWPYDFIIMLMGEMLEIVYP